MLPRTLPSARVWSMRAISAAALALPSICSANVFNGGFGVRTLANPGVADLATGNFFAQPLGDNLILQTLPSSSHSSTLPKTYSRTDTYDLGYDSDTNTEILAPRLLGRLSMSRRRLRHLRPRRAPPLFLCPR